MAPQRRLSVGAWLKQLPRPDAGDHATEAAFFEEHWRYGGRIHEEAVKALVGALNEPSQVAVGHGLFLRLFTEFANALETVGAWGWAIRNRRDFPMLLDGFLAYPHTAPREFFQNVKRNRAGIVTLLRLPPEEKLLPAMVDGFEGWTTADCRLALDEMYVSLQDAARAYFTENEIFRTTYNKAKHGATMLRTDDMDTREFYVVAPHLIIRGPKDRVRYDLTKFAVNSSTVGPLERRTQVIGATIRTMSGLCRALLRAEILYPRRRGVT